MKKIITTFILSGCFLLCFATIADLSGIWVGTLKTPNGNYPLRYNFILGGDQVTGTASTPKGLVPITDSKVDGNNFTFTVNVNGVPVKNTCKYYTDGDSITVVLDYNGYKMQSTLKRDAKM